MRKSSVYVLTAAAAMTIAGALPAYAATGVYNIPGGKMIVIGGNGQTDMNNILGQLGNGMNIQDCIPNFPGTWMPDVNYPDFNFPDINFPDINYPDNSLPAPDQPVDPAPDQPEDGAMDAYAKRVVELVNAERARAGLSLLSVHTAAAGAAQTRAKEIETVFSHTRPDGSAFSSVLALAGINFRGAGENIAYGQQTPEQVMETWMNSAGHRANILNSSFTSIGVGHYKNSAGVNYWTQLFLN